MKGPGFTSKHFSAKAGMEAETRHQLSTSPTGLADLVRRYYEQQVITIRETKALLDLMESCGDYPSLKSAG